MHEVSTVLFWICSWWPTSKPRPSIGLQMAVPLCNGDKEEWWFLLSDVGVHYTNLSFRTTAITRMFNCGIPEKVIAENSRHRSTKALQCLWKDLWEVAGGCHHSDQQSYKSCHPRVHGCHQEYTLPRVCNLHSSSVDCIFHSSLLLTQSGLHLNLSAVFTED